MTDRQAFLEAWRSWDRRPTNREATIAFEAQCQALASLLDISVCSLREDLSDLRREGRALAIALEYFLRLHKEAA